MSLPAPVSASPHSPTPYLLETGAQLGARREALGELHLDAARAGQEARVASHRAHAVHTVVDSALNVVQNVLRRAAHENRAHARVLHRLAQHRHAVRADLLDVDGGAEAHVLRAEDVRLRNQLGADALGDAAQLKLGHELGAHDLVLLEVVHGQRADGGRDDDGANAAVGNLLDVLRGRKEAGESTWRRQKWGSSE